MLPKLPKYPDGEFLGTLLCKGQRTTTEAYRDGYDRIFGKKSLPHGRDREKVTMTIEKMPPESEEEIDKWLDEMAAKREEIPNLIKDRPFRLRFDRPQTATEALCPCTGCPVHQPDENDCNDCAFPDFPEEEI